MALHSRRSPVLGQRAARPRLQRGGLIAAHAYSMTPPRWAVFGVGLLLVLAIAERWPKLGWPLIGILVLGMLVTHPDLLRRMRL